MGAPPDAGTFSKELPGLGARVEDGETEARTQILVKELGAISGFLPASWAPILEECYCLKRPH